MKRTLYTLLFLLSFMNGNASHIIGGSIYYDDLGNGFYEVTLTLYRDCSSETEYDDPASIGCFDQDGNLVENLEINFSEDIVTEVPAESNSACFMAPLGLCVEEAIYIGTVELPPIPGGYTLTYQRCCRNFSIVNVPTGTDVGITLTTNIPGPEVVTTNSNPAFATHPPLVICLGAPFVFDHSALDEDGDELVYEFCEPLNTNVDGNYINPPGAPPYDGLAYFAGYTADYPIDADPAFQIDPNSGLITGTPTSLGQYVVGVCISEYRDGVLINQTNRDFQLNVTTCEPMDAPIIADQINTCSGLTVEFINDSPQDLTYHWDFGVAEFTNDTSNVYEPTYTYPAPGEYDIMLILNPGLPCADTAFAVYSSSPSISPSISDYGFECNDGQLSFSFFGEIATAGAATFDWDFGTQATPSTSNSPEPFGIVFDETVTAATIELSVTQNGCSESTTADIEVPQAVFADIEEQNTFCDGFTYQFNNLSQNADIFQWDFGIGNGAGTSTLEDPLFTFSDTGLYHVRLIATTENVCSDTAYTDMLIYGLLNPIFESPDPQCLESNSFSFTADGATTTDANYAWNFGIEAEPLQSFAQNPTGIHFVTTGTFPVSLTITENDCVETYVDSVKVFSDPEFIAIGDTLLTCADESAFFHGESVADSPVNYLWDFGDATTSTLSATSHLYSEPGVYDVTVEMWTSSGCIASETAVFEDIVTVVSPPVAGFVISDNLMNLPGTEIQINSVAGDNMTCYYVMSDGGISEDCDFSYTFSNSGEMTITQTVTDEFGCQNSITGAVIISGYVFFAPNAFTPDDDGLNDVWKPEATGISEYYLRIYNRWGDMIFSTTDMDKPWVGDVHNGEYYAQNDIYNYIVTAKDLMGLPKEFKGHVVLMR